jgi:alkaline phosphatase D
MDNERVSRRTMLRAGAVGAGVLAAGAGMPGVALAGRQRPVLTHGVQTGDVTTDGAIVWTRADRPSRMLVEVSYDENFRHAHTVRGPVLTPATGGTGKLRLDHLAPGRTVHYRVTAEDLDRRTRSEALTGSFQTAPTGREDVRFTWSGDVAGQGWGINPDIGGMTAYRSMLRRDPDFFLHSGDTVYSDGPLVESVTLPDGRVWRNIVTPEKSKVAETLDEYRGQFAYNLLDDNVRAFAARVPSFVQWDDHEVLNNWYPGEILDLPQYTEKRVDVLAGRASQAFHEWQPIDKRRAVDGRVYRSFRYGKHVELFVLDMRTYKDANTAPRDQPGVILGARQARWLVDGLSKSQATWKIVANDLPIGLTVPDGTDIEGVANGLPGVPGGREHELAGVFRTLARRRVRNVVWLTADVHYTAAHHYSPDRAAIGDFDPFWEFVSGPLHAGAFGPNALDPTFGPQLMFSHTPPAANASPLEGFQHFGEVNIDGGSGALTVDLRDGQGSACGPKPLCHSGSTLLAVSMKKLPVTPAEIRVLLSLTSDWTREGVESALVGAGWATDGDPLEWSAGASSPHFFGEDENGWRLELGDAPGEPGASVRLPCALFWPALDVEEDDYDDDDFASDEVEVDDIDDEYTAVWERDPGAERDVFDDEFARLSELLRAELGEPDKRTEGLEPEETWHRDGFEIRLEMTDDINSYSHYDLIAIQVRSAL